MFSRFFSSDPENITENGEKSTNSGQSNRDVTGNLKKIKKIFDTVSRLMYH